MKPKPCIMWAIVNSDDAYFWCIRPQRKEAVAEFVGNDRHGYGWAYFKRRGFSAVKVKVARAL